MTFLYEDWEAPVARRTGTNDTLGWRGKGNETDVHEIQTNSQPLYQAFTKARMISLHPYCYAVRKQIKTNGAGLELKRIGWEQ
ncbi:hypothetical protein BK142_14000 [Paenibacillus glucanolyticus]|nr:hypothetical protein BK142_14000 [Paenibacillus glucanolyticus]